MQYRGKQIYLQICVICSESNCKVGILGGSSGICMWRSRSNLVHKLLHTCLKSPHLELHCHKLIGAHDGVLRVSPSLLQQTPGCLLGFKVSWVLKWKYKLKMVHRVNFIYNILECNILNFLRFIIHRRIERRQEKVGPRSGYYRNPHANNAKP